MPRRRPAPGAAAASRKGLRAQLVVLPHVLRSACHLGSGADDPPMTASSSDKSSSTTSGPPGNYFNQLCAAARKVARWGDAVDWRSKNERRPLNGSRKESVGRRLSCFRWFGNGLVELGAPLADDAGEVGSSAGLSCGPIVNRFSL